MYVVLLPSTSVVCYILHITFYVSYHILCQKVITFYVSITFYVIILIYGGTGSLKMLLGVDRLYIYPVYFNCHDHYSKTFCKSWIKGLRFVRTPIPNIGTLVNYSLIQLTMTLDTNLNIIKVKPSFPTFLINSPPSQVMVSEIQTSRSIFE